MKFTLYQLNKDRANPVLLFSGTSWLEDNGLKIEFGNYDAVYGGNVEADTFTDACEKLYMLFNSRERPADYKVRSMSVSDVVKLEAYGRAYWFYCNSIGFQRLPDDWGREP